MKKSILLLAMANVAMLATSCGNCKKAGKSAETLESTQWKLERMNGETKPAFAEGDTFTLEFLQKDGRIAGKGACNRFMGSYTLEKGDILDIKMGGATMMACPNLDLEQPYFAMLDGADKYTIKNGTLELFKEGKAVAEFKKFTPAPDMHNAENSLDIVGEYNGTLPAADCPGIKTTLTLNNDKTYSLNMKYIDRDSQFTDKGTYTVNNNTLILNCKGKETKYKLGENTVTMLNADGTVNTGELAAHYVLTKR